MNTMYRCPRLFLTDSCEASVARSTLPLMFCVCLSPVGRVAQNMSKKAWAANRKRSMSAGIAENIGRI